MDFTALHFCRTYRLVSSFLCLLLVFLGFFIASLCENRYTSWYRCRTTTVSNGGVRVFQECVLMLLINAKQDSSLKHTLTGFPWGRVLWRRFWSRAFLLFRVILVILRFRTLRKETRQVARSWKCFCFLLLRENVVCLPSENEIVSCGASWISSSVSWFWSDGADTRAGKMEETIKYEIKQQQ